MKKELGFVILFLVLVMSINVCALFNINANATNLNIIYGSNEKIKGTINMSFDDESADSFFTSNFNGGLNLRDFLDANSIFYNCFPDDCSNNYLTSNSAVTKQFSLDNSEKIFSFVLNGDVKKIKELRFNVSVLNSDSCFNPLKIDLLNDGSYDWKSKITTNEIGCFYKKGTGCFDSDEVLSEVFISTKTYCERITLVEGEKFELGAWVQKQTTAWENELLKMVLYKIDGEELANCNLQEPAVSGGEIGCIVNYSNNNIQDYYVCIKAKKDTDYKIKSEGNNPCGFFATPGEETTYQDYYIFAKAYKFGNIGNFQFNQQEYEKQNSGGYLTNYLDNYISDKYNGNCNQGCVIPIRFKGFGNIKVALSELKLSYETEIGESAPEDKIYDSKLEAPELSTEIVELDLKFLNITTPESYGKQDFSLYFDEQEILEGSIFVEEIPVIKSIFPEFVSAGVLTKFSLTMGLPSNRSIVSFSWDFGEVIVKTTTNYIEHIYSSIGIFYVGVEIEDNGGFKSSETFEISVQSPKDVANSTITRYKKRISSLSTQINEMPFYYKTLVENKIDLENLKSRLNNLEKKYNFASGIDDYVDVMLNLTELNIPESLEKSNERSLIFFVDYNDINPEYLKEMGAGVFSDSKDYEKAIALWTEQNLELKINFQDILGLYDDYSERLLGIFEVNINPIEESHDELYFLIKHKDIKFDKDYEIKDFSDAIGIVFPRTELETIGFAGDIDFGNLVFYLSPKFNKLVFEEIAPCNFNGVCETGEDWKNCRADCKPWKSAFVLFLIIILLGLSAYLILRWWYVRNYENHLFKDRNYVYNIMGFINNARSQGLSDKDIKSKLKNSGWNLEQINYVLRKSYGKGIMPFDILGLFRKKDKNF
ncbi:MAG: PKD domain-containing protein [Nanoarchaeota archaeon]